MADTPERYFLQLREEKRRAQSHRSRIDLRKNIGKRTGKVFSIGEIADVSQLFKSFDSSASSDAVDASTTSLPISVRSNKASRTAPPPPAFSSSGSGEDDHDIIIKSSQHIQPEENPDSVTNNDRHAHQKQIRNETSSPHSRTFVNQSTQCTSPHQIKAKKRTTPSHTRETGYRESSTQADASNVGTSDASLTKTKIVTEQHVSPAHHRNSPSAAISASDEEESQQLFEKILLSRRSATKSYGSPYMHREALLSHSASKRKINTGTGQQLDVSRSPSKILNDYTQMISSSNSKHVGMDGTKTGSLTNTSSTTLTPKQSQHSLLRRRLSFKDGISESSPKPIINIIQNAEVSAIHPLFELDDSSSISPGELIVEATENTEKPDSKWLFSSPSAREHHPSMLIRRKSSSKKEENRRGRSSTKSTSKRSASKNSSRKSNEEYTSTFESERRPQSQTDNKIPSVDQGRPKSRAKLDFSDRDRKSVQDSSYYSKSTSRDRVEPSSKKTLNFSSQSNLSDAQHNNTSTSRERTQSRHKKSSSNMGHINRVGKHTILVNYSSSDDERYDEYTHPLTVKKKQHIRSPSISLSNKKHMSPNISTKMKPHERRHGRSKRRNSSKHKSLAEEDIMMEDSDEDNTITKENSKSRRGRDQNHFDSEIKRTIASNKKLNKSQNRQSSNVKKGPNKQYPTEDEGSRNIDYDADHNDYTDSQGTKSPKKRRTDLYMDLNADRSKKYNTSILTKDPNKKRSPLYSDSSVNDDTDNVRSASQQSERKNMTKRKILTKSRKLSSDKNRRKSNKNNQFQFAANSSQGSQNDEYDQFTSSKNVSKQKSRQSDTNNDDFIENHQQSPSPPKRRKSSKIQNSRKSAVKKVRTKAGLPQKQNKNDTNLQSWLDSANSNDGERTTLPLQPASEFKSPRALAKDKDKRTSSLRKADNTEESFTEDNHDHHPPLPRVNESSINISVDRNRIIPRLSSGFGPPSSTPRALKRAKKRTNADPVPPTDRNIKKVADKGVDVIKSDTEDSRSSNDTYSERKRSDKNQTNSKRRGRPKKQQTSNSKISDIKKKKSILQSTTIPKFVDNIPAVEYFDDDLVDAPINENNNSKIIKMRSLSNNASHEDVDVSGIISSRTQNSKLNKSNRSLQSQRSQSKESKTKKSQSQKNRSNDTTKNSQSQRNQSRDSSKSRSSRDSAKKSKESRRSHSSDSANKSSKSKRSQSGDSMTRSQSMDSTTRDDMGSSAATQGYFEDAVENSQFIPVSSRVNVVPRRRGRPKIRDQVLNPVTTNPVSVAADVDVGNKRRGRPKKGEKSLKSVKTKQSTNKKTRVVSKKANVKGGKYLKKQSTSNDEQEKTLVASDNDKTLMGNQSSKTTKKMTAAKKKKKDRGSSTNIFQVPETLDIIIPENITEDLGVRRSKRIRMRPLRPGEHKVYGERGEMIGVERNREIIPIDRNHAGILHIESNHDTTITMMKDISTSKREASKKNVPKKMKQKTTKQASKKQKTKDKDNKDSQRDAANDQEQSQMAWFDDIGSTTSHVSENAGNNDLTNNQTLSRNGTASSTMLENKTLEIVDSTTDILVPVDASSIICNDVGLFGSPIKPLHNVDGIWISKGLSMDGAVQGRLVIQPKCTKGERVVTQAHMCFYVATGVLSLTVGGSTMTVPEGTYFRVPCRNRYKLHNPHNHIPVVLVYTMIRVQNGNNTTNKS